MHQHVTRILLAAASLCAISGAAPGAAYADAFTWKPNTLGLAGSRFTADSLILGDYAQIRFAPDGTTFTDRGYMPILGFMLQDQAVRPAGFNTAGQSGWGAYISYTASGIQTWSEAGIPVRATFTALTYEILGYNGTATFSFDGNGTPVIGGTQSRVTTLGAGSLVPGQNGLLFQWLSPAGPTIAGSASTAVAGVPPQLSNDKFAGFGVDFLHPPEDYAFTSPNTLQIRDPSGHSTATFLTGRGAPLAALALSAPAALALAAVEVPEPGTAALVGAGLLSLGLLRRRR